MPALKLAVIWTALFLVGFASTIAWAAETYRIAQRNRAFVIKEITIRAGDVIQYVNEDEFIHQIYVTSPTFNFDSAESQPGDIIDLKFTTPGVFMVRCHIHPKKIMQVTVQ